MKEKRPSLPASLTARYALVTVLVLGVLAVLLDRLLARGWPSRPLLAIALGVAALTGIITVTVLVRSAGRRLSEINDSLSRMAAGDLSARISTPQGDELSALAETLNRMAADLDARIEEVRRDRQQSEVILASMEEGVILIDATGEVGYANPAARRMLAGRPASIRELSPVPLRPLVEEALEAGQTREREVETGFPPRVWRASALPLVEPGGVLLVLRDITAARRVEAMRRDFVADASHELKTPAAAIQAAAETLDRAVVEDPAAAARFAARLRRDAVRLSRIVSDLLDLSRLESERPELGPVRLDRIVADEVDRLRGQAREAGVRLDRESTGVTVRGSTKDLSLLARNLLDNAVRYTPEGGRVKVDVSAENGSAVFTVADSGIGIPSRDLPRIFERFYRVDRARSRDTGGTGLGLSIARHVAEQHGGRIEAHSELGRGTTFRVRLPLVERRT